MQKQLKRIDVVSLFPEYFSAPFDVSMLKRAREKGIVQINTVDIRQFGEGKWKKVDDRPCGGGPGMLLMPGPLTSAIRSVNSEESHVVYLTPQGTPLTAEKCWELSRRPHLIVLCGHYEGIDERVIEKEVDEEISIGDYVLTSGSPAAVVLVDAVVRLVPGVVGNPEGVCRDSFEDSELPFEGPQYTQPVEFEGSKVPEVLLSGNHARIKEWKEKEAKKKLDKVRLR